MQELVTAAQGGNPEAVSELWQKVRLLAFSVANQYSSMADTCAGVSREDLTQCAALGVMVALQSYAPEKGAFTSWLPYHVRNACRECLGLTGRERLEHYRSVSLDKPLPGAEDLTIGDTLPDERAVEAYVEAEHAHDNEILRRDLDAALERLPPPCRDAIISHDLNGNPLSPGEVQPRRRGLRQLRRDRDIIPYAPNYHRHKGLAAFRTSWSSVVEDEVIRLLDRRRKTT